MARRKVKPAARESVEGPWTLPDGWRWERLDNVADLLRGVSYAKPQLRSADDTTAIALLRGNNIQRGHVDESDLAYVDQGCVSRDQFLQAKDVVLTMSSGSISLIGKSAWVPNKLERTTFGAFCGVIRSFDIDARWLFFFMQTDHYRRYIQELAKGTNINNLKREHLVGLAVPVPPMNVQPQLVAAVEKLFTEVDDGEAALERARGDLATWRKALLKAAVTGELSSDWRAANPPTETGADLLARILAERRTRWRAEPRNKGKRYVEPEGPVPPEPAGLPPSWGWTTLGSVFDVFVGSTPPRGEARLWGGDIPWVSSGEVGFCRIRATRETIHRGALGESEKRLHPPGTVMLGMIGEGKTRGQAAILDVWAAHNQNCASIRVSETSILPEFVYLFLRERYEETRSGSSGGNQPALNKARIEGFAMPVPSVNEQLEIVASIDLAEAAWDRETLDGDIAAVLRQSILAAAFRGALVV